MQAEGYDFEFIFLFLLAFVGGQSNSCKEKCTDMPFLCTSHVKFWNKQADLKKKNG